jgi:serine/threonine protein kinase
VLRHTVVVSDRKYKLEDFDMPYLLGKGGFATVYLAELKENKRKGLDIKYAMKQIPKKRLFERRVVENLKIERQVLADIKSPFIIELSFAFQDKQNCYFVMEYASGGDVYSFLNSSGSPGKVS